MAVFDRLLILIAICIAIGIGGYLYINLSAPVPSESDGIPIDISRDPIQTPDTTFLPPLLLRGTRYFFTVKASYSLSGMIVSTRRYPSGFMSILSPYDYATIWGKVPDYLSYIKFNQVVRYCLFSYDLASPVDKDYIQKHMANNHMIPATANLRKALKLAKKDDLVQIDGYLVYVMANMRKRGVATWNSSLTRDDGGAGACEIIYVQKLRINDKVYE
jgi:hypothetical protein